MKALWMLSAGSFRENSRKKGVSMQRKSFLSLSLLTPFFPLIGCYEECMKDAKHLKSEDANCV